MSIHQLIPSGPEPVSRAEYDRIQAAGMSEAVLQATIIGAAQRLGWLVYHTHDSRRSQAGYPDLHLVHLGQKRSLFRELKTQKGKLSFDQSRWLDALDAAGADAAVWRPIDWMNGTIENELYPPEAAL